MANIEAMPLVVGTGGVEELWSLVDRMGFIVVGICSMEAVLMSLSSGCEYIICAGISIMLHHDFSFPF